MAIDAVTGKVMAVSAAAGFRETIGLAAQFSTGVAFSASLSQQTAHARRFQPVTCCDCIDPWRRRGATLQRRARRFRRQRANAGRRGVLVFRLTASPGQFRQLLSPVTQRGFDFTGGRQGIEVTSTAIAVEVRGDIDRYDCCSKATSNRLQPRLLLEAPRDIRQRAKTRANASAVG